MYAFKKQCVFSAVYLERKCLSLHNNITQPFSKTACTQGQTKSRAKPLLNTRLSQNPLIYKQPKLKQYKEDAVVKPRAKLTDQQQHKRTEL